MEIGLATAFFGGMLALLSPCSALLLPAFFASTVGSGPRLWAHGGIFYLGLLVVLVPLGVGAGAVGTLFVAHRDAVVLGASVLLIVLGIVQMLGLGFDAARLVPGVRSAQREAATRSGWTKSFLLGAASGVAGFCAGPILGAVLTVAAAQGQVVAAGALLAVYGAGMVLPLLVLASLWGRIGSRTRAALRGRTVTVLGRELHTTSLITGALLVVVGAVFWITNGLVGMPELLPVGVQGWLQERGALLSGTVVDVAAILVVAAVVIALWTRRRARAQAHAEADRTPSSTTATEGES